MEHEDILMMGHYDTIASNIMCDVCAHFLQRVHFIEQEYTIRRGILYSSYGQSTLIHCLKDLPLEFFAELKNYEKIDDDILSEKVDSIKRSNWYTGAHTGFYEACAKIVILGIVAMGHGCKPEAKLQAEIAKMAKKAYDHKILDEYYDIARKNAQDILYTIFKIHGADMNEFISAEAKIEVNEFHFSESLNRYTIDIGRYTMNLLESSDNYKVMTREKFSLLVNELIELLKKRPRVNCINNPSNPIMHFLVLAIQVGCISLYCARNSYKEAVQQAFDFVVEFILLEKRLRFFTSIAD